MVMAASDYDDDVDLPSPRMKHDVLHRLRIYRVPGLQVKRNFVFQIFKRGSCFFLCFCAHIFPAWLSRNIDYGEIFVKGMLEYDAKFTEHRY